MTRQDHARRRVRNLARACAAMCAGMVLVTVAQALRSDSNVKAAGQNAGAAQVRVAPPDPTAGQPLLSGGSATPFALGLPTGAACTGDTAAGGYRVQSYMVPASVDPGALTFGPDGPTPADVGAALRQPLFSTASTPFVNVNTAVATSPGGPGLVTNLPTFSFAVFGSSGPQVVPPGTYNIGYACTVGGEYALDKYWNARLTFVADATDQPSGITWTAVDTPPSATTTTVGSTTTVAGSTTTIGGSTTTVAVDVATSTTSVGSGGSSGGYGGGTSGGSLVVTGGSPLPTLLWASLLLVFGRMAILLGRPVKVIPADSR